MVIYMKHQYSAISEYSMINDSPDAIRKWLRSSQQDFQANHSQLPVNNMEQIIPGICDLQLSHISAQYDPNCVSWKTFQLLLFQDTLESFSETWPKQGIIQDGKFYQQPNWKHRIKEISSRFWPTPNKWDANRGPLSRELLEKGENQITLVTAVKDSTRTNPVKYWPTPVACDYKERGPNSKQKGLPEKVRMCETIVASNSKGSMNRKRPQLNPDWVEWLMGWPIGWTDLKPLEMDKYQQWYKQHSNY